MKKLALIFLLLVGRLLAQEDMTVGNTGNEVGIPLGVKFFDIGFSKSEYLNVATCNATSYIVLRWSGKFSKDVVGFEIATGVPKCEISPKDFGLVPLVDLSYAATVGMNFTTPREIGNVRLHEVKVSGFDYVFQVFAVNQYSEIIERSQILYVKQKRQ